MPSLVCETTKNSPHLTIQNIKNYSFWRIICPANKNIFNYLKLKKDKEDGFGQKVGNVDDIKYYLDQESENSDSDVQLN